MDVYLLKSVACLGILFLFYKIVLENTTLHTIKRFFLLGSLVVAFGIPFVTFTEYVEVAPMVNPMAEFPLPTIETTVEATPVNYVPYLLGVVYGIGVLIFGFRFVRNMLRIFNKVRRNPKFKTRSVFHVLLQLPVTPHSFFNYIFFSKNNYETGTIPPEVIVHETAHATQKHSWDIVAIELLRVVFWFNPLLYFIKHSIKLNHEFLADRAVLKQGTDAVAYQKILLDFSSLSSVPVLAHAINYSSIKKRFTVMKTHTTKRAAWLKTLLVLPLLAALVYGFSTSQIVEKASADAETAMEFPKVPTSVIEVQIHVNTTGGILVNENLTDIENLESTLLTLGYNKVSPPQPTNLVADIYASDEVSMEKIFDIREVLRGFGLYRQNNHATAKGSDANKKASDQQLKMYNKLAKKYNAVPIAERKIGWEDLRTLENIYRVMSDEQKAEALPFPECLPKHQSSWEVDYAKMYNDGAARNKKKSIVITINVSEIMVNGKATSLKNFAKEVDRATKDWTEADFKASHPSILVASTPKEFLNRVDIEFQKTRYAKLTGLKSIVPPPPPAPDAIKVIKGLNDADPNIPPPPPAPSTPKVNSKGNLMVYAKSPQAAQATPPPPPPPAPEALKVIKGVNDHNPNVPPPPPPPKSPLEHVVEMAKKGATFYYDGEKISSDKAIELVKNNKDLNIQIKGSNTKNPQVKISTEPIQLKN